MHSRERALSAVDQKGLICVWDPRRVPDERGHLGVKTMNQNFRSSVRKKQLGRSIGSYSPVRPQQALHPLNQAAIRTNAKLCQFTKTDPFTRKRAIRQWLVNGIDGPFGSIHHLAIGDHENTQNGRRRETMEQIISR